MKIDQTLKLDRLLRSVDNASSAERTANTMRRYLVVAEMFAGRPDLRRCDDTIMAMIYPLWPTFNDRVRKSRRTEVNTLVYVAQNDLGFVKELAARNSSKRDFLRLLNKRKWELPMELHQRNLKEAMR